MENLLTDNNNKIDDDVHPMKYQYECAPNMKWAFKNNRNAEEFRRSMLPFYLLKDSQGSEHPMYIEKSTISQHLSEKTSVTFMIYFSKDIIDYMVDISKNLKWMNDDANQMGSNLKKLQTMRDKVKCIPIPNFYLLKTAQSLIDQVTNHLY